ncbi:MAG: two-component regulator propeller domain-containing protein [Bacteroidota bacterium]
MRSSVRFLFAVMFCWLGASGQQYNIKSYSSKNGLANSIVNSVFLDSRGFLWFATQSGVSKFDGKSFTNYTSKQGLPGNDITNICEDAEGNIWVATNGFGVSRFDGQKFTNYSKKDGLGEDVVYKIFLDSKKKLWFATFGGGISVYDGKQFKTYTTSDGLPCNEFFTVTEDKYGTIWFGSRGKGVIKFSDGKFYSYTKEDGLSHDKVYSLYFDKTGRLWIGTTAGGINTMFEQQFQPFTIPGYETALIYGILQDKHDFIWIATENGLIKYDGKNYKIFTESQGLIGGDITSICEDYEGNIWITTHTGVSMFKNEAFVTYTDKEKLSSNKINVIYEDSRGNILVGTNGSGLNMIRGGEVISLQDIKQLENANVYSFYEDKNGDLWVGAEFSEIVVLSYANGRYKYARSISALNGISVRTASSIIEDKEGRVWVATYGGGIFRIAGAKTDHFTDSTGLTTNDIFTLYEDKTGAIWVGTYQGGLLRFKDGKFEVFRKENGLGDNSVWSVTQDAKGNLYFGTNENGVSCYDGKNFRSITMAEGLSSNLIYALAVDDKERLWVGTDKGLHKISLGNNFEILGMKSYGEDDGLKGVEISQHGLFYDSRGELWIATSNGLTRYNAYFDYVNSNPPRVILTDIKLYYQNVDWKKYADSIDPVTKLPLNLSLSYKDNHLTFDFRALTTDNVQYQFILEGLDDKWSPLSNNTEAVYTNIPPGENYRFRVKAINSDGYESKEELVFGFAVRPPYYQTWWFYTICTVGVMGAVFSFIRYRTAQLQREKKILEEKVEERTVELKSANSQLSLAFTEIKDSINYAKRIQEAILPLEVDIKKELPEHFIFFKPRDVVSGDFYWFNQKGDKVYIAACDCTGHGVPGAFMSIIGNSLLNEIINENHVTEPAHIMNMLRQKLITSLKQQKGEQESKDGMDMVLCCIDKGSGKISFAAANNPLYLVSSGTLTEYKGDKQPVGISGTELKPFTHQEITVRPGDVFYMFTDGFPDQFGGAQGKKFLYKRFKEVLLSIHAKPMDVQHAELEKAFHQWKAEHYQVDDVLVIGIRV